MKLEGNLSSFGDVLLNFLYSYAISKASGRWEGRRVANSVLAQSLALSKLKKPSRSDRQTLGNYVESLIATAWIGGIVKTEECVEVLSSHLKSEDKKSEIEALRHLLDLIAERYQNDKTPDTDTRN